MTAADLHAALLARLTGATVTLYDGEVPPHPPADPQGRVYPYVVVWATAGRPTVERPVSDDPGGHLTWNPQVTVVAGTTSWLLAAIGVVRERLEGAALTPWVRLRERTDTEVPVQKDPDTTPARYFLPLYYSTTA
ncbi:hypothetical protein SAMN05216184_104102 [Georgenia satyanarayanai]|uniref:DUF3168 domain-containing protein n=1 Tax=Georgenia satyanarayanai TaxID=860221 RepID=A0A2Y9A7G5_9MICO|nr:hypothetical protein [Georgenia satyanarayanai]PYG00163.1 hypothetical protein A8987_104102 [Georgenia satyanarayanai]SSA40384.1 hypothetical protein SAMN05216184_104102 [Georgenia satyanarayanai]